MTDEPLFTNRVTHIEVRCWKCEHVVLMNRHDLPAGLTVESLTDRARCRECGEGLPDVTQLSKPKGRW